MTDQALRQELAETNIKFDFFSKYVGIKWIEEEQAPLAFSAKKWN